MSPTSNTSNFFGFAQVSAKRHGGNFLRMKLFIDALVHHLRLQTDVHWYRAVAGSVQVVHTPNRKPKTVRDIGAQQPLYILHCFAHHFAKATYCCWTDCDKLKINWRTYHLWTAIIEIWTWPWHLHCLNQRLVICRTIWHHLNKTTIKEVLNFKSSNQRIFIFHWNLLKFLETSQSCQSSHAAAWCAMLHPALKGQSFKSAWTTGSCHIGRAEAPNVISRKKHDKYIYTHKQWHAH